MQENEFEKQVKNKMDELNFIPSAPVWEAIKKQLEKKKRRVLPFIFFLAAAIIALGYFIYADVLNNINKSAGSITFNNKKINQNLLKKKMNEEIKSDKPHFASQKNNQTIIKENRNYNSMSSIILNSKNYYQQRKLTTVLNKKPSYAERNKTIQATQTSIKNNYSLSSTDTSDYKTTTAKNIDSLILKPTADSVKENTVVQIRSNNDSIIKTSLTKKNITNKISDTSASVFNNHQKPNRKNSAKWIWGITAMIGRSNIVNNLKFNNLKSAEPGSFDAASMDTTAVALNKNKPYWPAMAYDFGMIAQRRISKNSDLKFGLQFQHLSTKSYTGLNLNYALIPVPVSLSDVTAPNAYYRSGTKKTYTNKYNFVELPVSFQSKLFNVHRLGILYEGGVSVMQLLNKNSLLYNSVNKTYFKDTTSLLRRTQLQLSAALNFQLQTKHNGSFFIGPGIKYSLSGFQKSNDYYKLHYIHFDLSASWLFNKN